MAAHSAWQARLAVMLCCGGPLPAHCVAFLLLSYSPVLMVQFKSHAHLRSHIIRRSLDALVVSAQLQSRLDGILQVSCLPIAALQK